MTPDHVRMQVAAIGALHDSESAHADEDRLHSAVLHAIADGHCDDPAALARAALATEELTFSRWYA